MRSAFSLLFALFLASEVSSEAHAQPKNTFRAGAYAINVSPLKFPVIVNGCEGYIPPQELHPLGGYTCWRARTACLEPEAERRIRTRVLDLLASVTKHRADEEPLKSK